MTRRRKETHVLLVEDNAEDARQARAALGKLGDGKLVVHQARNSREAQSFLRSRRPTLILLDLSLANRDGFTVLAGVMADPELCDIPLAVLTESEKEATEVAERFDLMEHCVIPKWESMTDFLSLVQAIEDHEAEIAA